MSSWFKRKDKGIQTSTEEKKDTPKGLWYKSPTGKIIDTKELEQNFYVSPEDGYHVRIGSKEYFEILFDDNKFKELDEGLTSKDPLKFEDTKKISNLPNFTFHVIHRCSRVCYARWFYCQESFHLQIDVLAQIDYSYYN